MDSGLGISVRPVSRDAVVLDVTGAVDALTAPELKTAVKELMTHGDIHLVINLRKVSSIDNRGLAALLGSMHQIHRLKGNLNVASPSPVVKQALDSFNLTRILDVFPSERQALDSL